MTITPAAIASHTYTDVDNTTFGQNSIMIETAYSYGKAFQWAREFGFNSVEAGATLVSYTTEFVTARERGIHRRMIADNGSGMTRAGLSDCINKIGGGLSERGGGTAKNLGQGAKVASAYFNPAGVIYLSRTVEDGDAMAIYVRDDVTGEYGLLRTYGLDDDAVIVRRAIHRPQPLFLDEAGLVPFDEGTDWEAVMDEAFANLKNPESGTAVVFLGDGLRDTIFGDPERAEESTKYGLAKYLESRIWDVPQHVRIRVLEYRIWTDKAAWPTSENDEDLLPLKTDEVDDEGTGGHKRLQWRFIEGLRSHLYDPAYLVDKGSVAVVSADGIAAQMDWVISNFATMTKSGKARKGRSSTEINPGGIGTIMAVSAAAKMGLYDVMDFVSEESADARFRQFGIDADTVQEQLWFTISPAIYRPANRETGEPLVPGVGMDGSRSHLVATSKDRHAEGIETLMREWGRDFQSDAKFPAAIKKLLEDAWATATGDVVALDEKTSARIAEALDGALKREEAILGGKKPTAHTSGGFKVRRHVRTGQPRPIPVPPVNPPGPGKRDADGGPVTADGKDATKVSTKAVLPEVKWVPGDHPAWAESKALGAVALFRLPGTVGTKAAGGEVWLKGTNPTDAPSERKRHDGTAYATATEWLDDESPVVLAAVQDKQSEYGPSEAWAVEKAVKGSYVASAQSVAGHLLSEGKWDPVAKEWNPAGGITPEMMASAVEPFNFSNCLRGYYPQKQMAAGFFGSIVKKVRSAGKRASHPIRSAGSSADMAAMRDWAREHGHTVSSRGRLPQSVQDAYSAR